MRKIQIFKSGGGLQVPQKILDLLLIFLNCQKGMTTLIYQCENYFSPPLDTPLYIQKKSCQSVEKRRKFSFFPFGEKHLNGQNV